MSTTTKQKHRRRSSTASSSSEQTADYKAPNEILALGERIVRELELEPGVDTLGRWLAHHLAELILAARESEGAQREIAQKTAVDLILKIWSRRHDVPGGANPLRKLEEVIAILRFLRPDAWPYGVRDEFGSQRLLKKAFEGLQHIVAHGTLLASGISGRKVKFGEAEGFVEQDEAVLVETVNAWIDLYNSAPKGRIVSFILDDATELETAKSELEELQKLDPDLRARRLFELQIDRLIETLTDLKAALGERKDDPGVDTVEVEDET
jgi:hypothetical protein